MKKISYRICIGIFICICAFTVCISFFFYYLAIERGPKDFLQNNKDLEVDEKTMETFLDGSWIEWKDNQQFTPLQIESWDGTSLHGYYLEQKNPTDKLVIFGHGYLGNALQMSLYGQYYYEELGYNLFMPDFRGHGKSGGDYYGFGWHDRLDILQWIHKMNEINPENKIVLHGLSMGASTMLMVSGEAVPNNVKAIIADSPYTSVDELFAYHMDRMFHLPKEPLITTTSIVTQLRSNYHLKEASALNQVKKTNIPILYINGKEDTFVPTEMTNFLYKATKSPSNLVTFPNANHGESYVMYEYEYQKKLQLFLEDWIQ